MFSHRMRRNTTIAIVLLALVSLLAVMTAPLAAAHDRITGSTPEDGQEMDSAPASVELSFSGEIAEAGAAISIETPEATVEPEIAIDGDTLTADLAAVDAALPAGDYTVTWRVTSGDGHPISGDFSYSAAGGAASDTDPAEPNSSSSDGELPTGDRGDDVTSTANPAGSGAADSGNGNAEEGESADGDGSPMPTESTDSDSTGSSGNESADEESSTQAASDEAAAASGAESEGVASWVWAVLGVAVLAIAAAAVAWMRRSRSSADA